jgi:hypothetical protein
MIAGVARERVEITLHETGATKLTTELQGISQQGFQAPRAQVPLIVCGLAARRLWEARPPLGPVDSAHGKE